MIERTYQVHTDTDGEGRIVGDTMYAVSALDMSPNVAHVQARNRRIHVHGPWWLETMAILGRGRAYGPADMGAGAGADHIEIAYCWELTRQERWRNGSDVALLARTGVPLYTLDTWPTGRAAYWAACSGPTLEEIESGAAREIFHHGYDEAGLQLW